MKPALLYSALIILTTLFGSLASAQDVSTGPVLIDQSVLPSEYMRGIGSNEYKPTSLRIVGLRTSRSGITLEAILLDKNGNALGTVENQGVWSATVNCKNSPLGEPVIPTVAQLTWRSSSPTSRYAVLLDHSITSHDITKEALKGLYNLLPGIPGQDSIEIATFDHTTFEVTPLTTFSQAAVACNEVKLPDPSGIPASLTAMMSSLRVFDGKPASRNTLIVVTASNDMASLLYSTDDIVNKAKTLGVRIVVIKVGHTARGYLYRFLAASTGGRMYSLEFDDVEHIAPIIREVVYATNHHLEAFVNSPITNYTCNDLLLRLAWTADDGLTLADTMLLPLTTPRYGNSTAIVAAFQDTTDRGLHEYYPLLAVLADDLASNPNKRIRLVGHVSPDIENDAFRRGLERAEHVAGYLKANGVGENQIETFSDGALKPLYYLQLDGTQRLLNNRVEASFILPSDQPYTIQVEQVVSEQLAAKSVKKWEERGYKAYFEPAVVKHQPRYDVILWGYSTKDDAKSAAKLLKKYGVTEYMVR